MNIHTSNKNFPKYSSLEIIVLLKSQGFQKAKNCIDKNIRILLDIGMQIYQISGMFQKIITHGYE